MRHPLKRHYGQGDLHFVTFSCYRRRPLLGTGASARPVCENLDEVRCRHEFRLVGYVVMPEHVHLLLSEPAKKDPSKILQVLKQKVARALLKKREERRTDSCRFPLTAVQGKRRILAAPILRFQCVERQKAEGEAGIHACESGAKKARGTRQGLALEQLGALRRKGRK